MPSPRLAPSSHLPASYTPLHTPLHTPTSTSSRPSNAAPPSIHRLSSVSGTPSSPSTPLSDRLTLPDTRSPTPLFSSSLFTSPISLRRRDPPSPSPSTPSRPAKHCSVKSPAAPTAYTPSDSPLPARFTLGQSVRAIYTLSPPRVRSESSHLASPSPTPTSTPAPTTSALLPPALLTPKMVFHPHPNYLSVKLEAIFENYGVVDMVGGPNTGTSYSLPGHVVLSLPAVPSPLEGRLREVRELSVVTEGKSEYWDDHGRYTPMRLHTSTVTLATPAQPLLIPSADPSRPHLQRIHLALPFDMVLPGWLPPTHHSEMTSTSYGCVVHAIIGWTEASSASLAAESSSSAASDAGSTDIAMDSAVTFRPCLTKPKSRAFESLFSNTSLHPHSTRKASSKWHPFAVRRHRLPTPVGASAPERAERHFTLRPEADSTSPVECVVGVPEFVDVHGEEKGLRVSLRIRARRDAIMAAQVPVRGHTESAGKAGTAAAAAAAAVASGEEPQEGNARELESVPMERQGKSTDEVLDEVLTHMIEVGMEVEEVERFSSTPSASFVASFPIPEEQPARHSSQHQLISPRHPQADNGFLVFDDRPFKGIRTRSCLLSEDGNQRNFFFADNGLGLSDKWKKVNVVLPMPTDSGRGHNSKPQPEMDGPFLRVRHSLKIRVVCKNVNGEDTQVVLLSTPIRFGTCPATVPSATPHAPPLPAYIQLFLENGDLRECDPLPLYSEPSSAAAAAASQPALLAPHPIPDTPAPDYKSSVTDGDCFTDACPSRSPSPASSTTSSSYLPIPKPGNLAAALSRRAGSVSPPPALPLFSESMDIDGSSDEEGRREVPVTPRTPGGRKVIRTGVRSVVQTAS